MKMHDSEQHGKHLAAALSKTTRDCNLRDGALNCAVCHLRNALIDVLQPTIPPQRPLVSRGALVSRWPHLCLDLFLIVFFLCARTCMFPSGLCP